MIIFENNNFLKQQSLKIRIFENKNLLKQESLKIKIFKKRIFKNKHL